MGVYWRLGFKWKSSYASWKEIVLNQSDTKNLLDYINIVRDDVSSMNSGFAANIASAIAQGIAGMEEVYWVLNLQILEIQIITLIEIIHLILLQNSLMRIV